jgi:hypothetical protein
MLEALLRVEAFDAFGALLPVAERLQLPWRERREALATMYLRRGFLESAADEWIAVCQTAGPDARALAGLAHVAYLRDMGEDARLFAEEALGLDASNPTARAIVERVGATA